MWQLEGCFIDPETDEYVCKLGRVTGWGTRADGTHKTFREPATHDHRCENA